MGPEGCLAGKGTVFFVSFLETDSAGKLFFLPPVVHFTLGEPPAFSLVFLSDSTLLGASPAQPGFQISSELLAEFDRVIGRVPSAYARDLYRE